MMGFCPYFLHEKSSGGMSAIFELTAGTLTTLFNLDFLFFEQWHLPEDDPHFRAASSMELHFLFSEYDKGGLSADETCERWCVI